MEKPKMTLHPYIGYSRTAGPAEAACLIFAETAKKARAIGWHESEIAEYCDGGNDYMDWTVRRMPEDPHIMRQKKMDEPHVIDSPESCKSCGMWGYELDENGLCESCRDGNIDLDI
jgi:hypothetical protein